MALNPRRYDRVARRVALVVGAIGWFAAAGLGQQASPPPAKPQASFRTAIDVVTLSVTVLDRQRRPVRGLTAADFTVLEEGESRPIVAVEPVEVPATRPANLPVWHDQVLEDVATIAPKSGRLVVVFFDRSIAPGWDTERARRIAARAIDQLGPEDVAAIVYNYYLATPLNFTSDHKRLLSAINSPVIGTQVYDEKTGNCFCGLCGVESIEHIAKVLEPARGRQKMLVYVGGRIPLFEHPATFCAPWLEPATAAMFDTAQRAQMVIHAVDPAGVRTLPAFSAAGRSVPPGAGGRGANFDSLRRLAENTGGRTVLGTNEPEAEVPSLFEESTVSYLVGFTPRTSIADGKLQRVRVRVRGEDLTVLTASGYRHPSPADMAMPPTGSALRPPSAQTEAAAGLSPIAEIVMRATALAVPDPASPERAAVATVIGMEIPIGPAAAAPVIVEVGVAAFDTDGRPHGTDNHTMTLTARPGATTLACEVLSRLALRKGRYEIRATVSSADPLLTGSVYTFLDVDDFAQAPLAVSGLALHASQALRLVAAAAPNTWLPLPPTTSRTFARDARVTAGVRLFQPKGIAAQHAQVTTEVFDARGHLIVTTSSPLLPAAFDFRRVADYRFDLPLSTLTPGEYLLKVSVRQGRTEVSRTARFRVL